MAASQITSGEDADVKKIKTMRDVFDYCQKRNLYSVAQGMIELPPPLALRRICADALVAPDSQAIHQYRARFGEADYINSLRNFIQKHYGVQLPEGSILATSGVTAGLVSSLMLLRKRGKDRIAVIEPYYTYHAREVEQVFNKLPIGIPSHPDFSPDWQEIEKAMIAGLDGIILCNPNNPTGRCWTRDEISQIVALAKKYSVMLICDEIYCDMVFEGHTHYSPINDSLEEHVVVCRGFSKTLGAQSWRLGFAIAHPSVVPELMSHHDPIYISVTWQQHCLAKYLDEEYEDFKAHCNAINTLLRNNYRTLAPTFAETLGWQPIEPAGSMYGMFKHNQESDMDALQAALRLGVGVAPGNMFFVSNPANSEYIRIHVGISEEKAKQIAQTLRDNKAKLGDRKSVV